MIHFSAKEKIYLAGVLCALFLSLNLSVAPANAAKNPTDINTFDAYGQSTNQQGFLERTVDQAKTWVREDLWQNLKKSGDVAWKAALKNFLNTLAYDMATYLATGDEGQLPMFETDGWESYLTSVADSAAGTFIEQLGKNGYTQFNLCSPSTSVQLKISLGLTKSYNSSSSSSKPTCTFSTMVNNWDAALQSDTFMNDFQDMFNPWSNDLGIALTLQSGLSSTINSKVNSAVKTREEGKGFKSVTSSISGAIKTPAQTVMKAAGVPLDNSTKSALAYTGSVVADSIDIFVNTLAGKLIEQWLTEGLVSDDTETTSDLTTYDSGSTAEGAAGAKDRLVSIIEPDFKVRADYDILTDLTTCPDPNQAGPTNCVIDEKFREAIEKKMTVGEALTQGYLNGNGVFGFSASGLEPKFNEGYPYRSMIILRKYRIIPVGWEVAAQKIKDQQSAVQGTKNLNDLVNCFSNEDDYGAKGDVPDWCAGLVDPDWLLKAPQNFCKREGAGPEILSQQVTGEGDDSKLSVLRNDTYCADEQSCIKEKSDGSCQLYGYCTEERRKWDFNAKSCEPRDNTCQTFSSTDGGTVSYLKNTLDYGGCNAANAGCLAYCRDYNYAGQDFTCTGSAGSKVHLNGQTEECDSASEGCSQLVRLNAGGGANLLINSGFEEALANGGWSDFGATSTTSYQGGNSLQMSRSSSKDTAVGGSDYDIAGENYTLSFYARDCSSDDTFWLGVQSNSAELKAETTWSRYSLTYAYPASAATNNVIFTINSHSCLIDNIKLERGDKLTAYSDYAAAAPPLIYEKLLPAYLASGSDGIQGACYEFSDGSYKLKSGAPAQCSDYARHCGKDEAGCELYTSADGQTKIPAKTAAEDYCPAECVGYNFFVASQTHFAGAYDAYFIPKTAKTCSAEAAGCEQFTNLDEVAKGGEGTEYYSYLRQCLKKSDNESSCADFYNWEGSDESGYQLKVESLKLAGNEPAVSESDAGSCDATIYNLLPADPAYNADCRQFYNRDGAISYHLYSRTISCAADCHPYRLTALNTDETITSDDDCAGTDKHWLDGRCVVCKNGGVWSSENNACLYQAVAGQAVSCSAAQNGCREYVGNTGNNVKNIFTDDFGSGTVGAWTGNVEPSNESLTLGSGNIGHSLSVNDSPFSASRPLGGAVSENKSYVLSFLAKKEDTAGTINLDISLNSGGAGNLKAEFVQAQNVGANWQIYTVNLISLNHKVTADEFLLIKGSAIFYLDSIILTEITDRYYLIKDSWNTPASCDSDQSDNLPGPELGCSQYLNRANQTNNLKQFSRLCSESAVGCELMIDTKNTASPGASYYLSGQSVASCSGGDCVTVPADSYAYVVYDAEKLCGAEEKGCEFLGRPSAYGDLTFYSGVHLKNNPDKYHSILCGADAVYCRTYVYAGGEQYFKDPGDQVCEWRSAANQGSAQNWYRKKVKRCGAGGEVCLSDADCPVNVECKLETADTLCPMDTDANGLAKTLGFGGSAPVSQPASPAGGTSGNGWTGICSASDSGCSEYLDPKSSFNTNQIFNGSFADLDNNPGTVNDGWNACAGGLCQSVTLDPNTVYRLGRQTKSGTLTIDQCSFGSLYEINNDNNLAGPASSVAIAAPPYLNSKIFYYKGDEPASCTVTAGNSNEPVELKKVVVDYQLEGGLDKATCNGMVNSSQGCVLFNERNYGSSGLAALNWDADQTIQGKAPASGAADADNDSNMIINVSPDRTCDKWLACKSYIKDENGDNVCFDIGLCDAVDENGDCRSFLNSKKTNQLLGVNGLDASKISNLSGYAKVGASGSTLGTDYYPLGGMSQLGEMANVPNGGFETVGSNSYPLGWSWSWSGGTSGSWDANFFSVIDNPVAAQTDGINYAPEGNSLLKLGSSYVATSEEIDAMPGTDYVITAYINTINLQVGTAMIDILDKDGNSLSAQIITQDLGYDWKFRLGKFKTGADVSSLKVRLYATAAGGAQAQGNFYFDDIKIKPALNSRDSWYTPQSCRLYPQTDSLSCDYYQDSGIRQKGWPGYCLEYDRRPGDPDTCLLWYPIDKVKGDGVEEGAGYQGKSPVYYCVETRGVCSNNQPLLYCSKLVMTVTSIGQNKYWASRVYEGSDYVMNGSANFSIDWGVGTEPSQLNFNYGLASSPFGSINPPEPSSNPYEWDGDSSTETTIEPIYFIQNPADDAAYAGAPYNSISYNIKEAPPLDCSTTFYVAAPANSYTTENVGAWDYCILTPSSVNCNVGGGICKVTRLPDSTYDVYVYDDSGDSPGPPTAYVNCGSSLIVSAYADASNAKENLKQIFAKSYGSWTWNSRTSRYLLDNSISWDLPDTVCPGDTRAAGDYCAIPPTISHVKVAGGTGNYTINNTGFINLTFNSTADPDQLPLVMYAVDWGDGTQTVVTGVQMRDKPNESQPETIYHLYSYWDLKAKDSQGSADIDCATTAGQCRVSPKVQIKDNWNWCNGGASMNDCSHWEDFGGAVVVKEK
ncbi:MAG: hypothetical protein PHS62_03775 [Patescibacteria group bacterium]|nr:hypothetical protein [Patescibacteria group bacterium]